MRVFVQSLDGEVRKWFRELPPNSIDGITTLEEVFMRQWGDTNDYFYYITEFGALKRKLGETVTDFTKHFNKMYSKILTEINPTETCAKIAYANTLDAEFSLLQRERRDITLVNMQEATLEVQSNLMETNKLRDELEYHGEDKKKKK